MSFDSGQVRPLVRDWIALLGEEKASAVAVELVLGTAAVESAFGTYLHQVGGPALGPWQIEPATFAWLRRRYGGLWGPLAAATAEQLVWDLRLGAVVCRLRYFAHPDPLPKEPDPALLGRYWKKVYNTGAGAGTVEGFIAAYQRFVR